MIRVSPNSWLREQEAIAEKVRNREKAMMENLVPVSERRSRSTRIAEMLKPVILAAFDGPIDFNLLIGEIDIIIKLRAMELCQDNRTQSAGVLGINRTTLVEFLKSRNLFVSKRPGRHRTVK